MNTLTLTLAAAAAAAAITATALLRRVCVALLCLALGGHVAAAAPAGVGEVAFAIGAAHAIDPQGASQPLRRGTALFEGQRVETGENGHVHIRFIDGASVAVRPQSRLLIQQYHYNAANPADNRVRFVLEQGEARAITGKAGEAAKDRFRLNTPIAAIGIKGTDFIVQVTPADTRVFVLGGAVVMAPLDATCLAETLGACGGARARELSAQMADQFLRLSAQHPLPEVHVVEHRPGASGRLAALEKAEPLTPSPSVDPQMQVAVAGARADALTAGAAAPAPLAAGTHIVPGMEALVPRLWWGRWPGYEDPAVPQSAYAFQRNVPGRELAAGAGIFGMLRDNPIVFTLPGGSADFNLARSEAYLVQGALLTPVAVSGGSLAINFDAGRFTTSLGVAGQQIGASGRLQGDGRFIGVSPAGTTIFGATASGGGQAGYAFQHNLAPGSFLSGATLWSRDPRP